jgi:hypothetical protein
MRRVFAFMLRSVAAQALRCVSKHEVGMTAATGRQQVIG